MPPLLSRGKQRAQSLQAARYQAKVGSYNFLESFLGAPVSEGCQALKSSDFICAKSCPTGPVTFHKQPCLERYSVWFMAVYPLICCSPRIISLVSYSPFSPWALPQCPALFCSSLRGWAQETCLCPQESSGENHRW